MALDKETVARLFKESYSMGAYADNTSFRFAQAIYELGVKDERERCALVCEDRAEQYEAVEPFACHAEYSEDRACAEAIRRGETK